MRGKIWMIKMTESVFVVSDLLWHDSFNSLLSELGLFSWLVFLLFTFPLFIDFVSLLISPQTRLSRNGPDKAQLSLWNLSVDSYAAFLNDITEHIYSSKLGCCVSSALFCVSGMRRFEMQGFWQVSESPAGGSGDFQVSPDWRSRPSWMSSKSLDVVFINYRPSRGSYCSRGGRRKANFTMFCVAIACIFVFIVLTLFWTAEVCPVFEKCMNIDLCPSMYYL